MDAQRTGRRNATLLIALIAALVGALAIAPGAPAAAKKGKVHVCVETRGKDKGVMHLAKGKHCHKGQKSVTFNKRGKRGRAGEPGAEGPQGPTGQGAPPDALAALQQQLAAQAEQLAALQSQLAAACTQLSTVTTQLNALGTALDGIGLGGTIPPLLTLISPGAPTPLAPVQLRLTPATRRTPRPGTASRSLGSRCGPARRAAGRGGSSAGRG